MAVLYCTILYCTLLESGEWLSLQTGEYLAVLQQLWRTSPFIPHHTQGWQRKLTGTRHYVANKQTLQQLWSTSPFIPHHTQGLHNIVGRLALCEGQL